MCQIAKIRKLLSDRDYKSHQKLFFLKKTTFEKRYTKEHMDRKYTDDVRKSLVEELLEGKTSYYGPLETRYIWRHQVKALDVEGDLYIMESRDSYKEGIEKDLLKRIYDSEKFQRRLIQENIKRISNNDCNWIFDVQYIKDPSEIITALKNNSKASELLVVAIEMTGYWTDKLARIYSASGVCIYDFIYKNKECQFCHEDKEWYWHQDIPGYSCPLV